VNGPGTGALRDPRLAGARDAARRFLSRWALLALAGELALAIVDASVHTASLTSSYLVPVLAVAIVETVERTTLVALVAVGLALLSGVWHDYLFATDHLYRLAIVAGGGCLGALGALFRSRAVVARDRMDMLARIAEVADGTVELDEALCRLAAILVPGGADLCELVVFEAGQPRRVVTRLAGSAAAAEAAFRERPGAPPAAATAAVRAGETFLVRRVSRDAETLGTEGQALREVDAVSAIYAPVRAGDETLALLILAVGRSGRRYGAEDLRFATTVGSRAALAIQN
jgi:hypothetical protein